MDFTEIQAARRRARDADVRPAPGRVRARRGHAPVGQRGQRVPRLPRRAGRRVARARAPGGRRCDRRAGAHAAPRVEPLLHRVAAAGRRHARRAARRRRAGCSSPTPAPRPTSARSSSRVATARRTAGPSATTCSRRTRRSTAARSPRSPPPGSPRSRRCSSRCRRASARSSSARSTRWRAAMDERVCAVMLEVVQGEGGVNPVPPGYLEAVRALCDEREALLVLDEVQTGLGRTGRWFAFEHTGARPDVVTMAKALGNGVPIGACWARDDIAAAFRPGDHATTFGGQPLAARAAFTVLEVMQAEDVPGAGRAGGRPARRGARCAARGHGGARAGASCSPRSWRRRSSRPRSRRRASRPAPCTAGRPGAEQRHAHRAAARAVAARERRRDRRRGRDPRRRAGASCRDRPAVPRGRRRQAGRAGRDARRGGALEGRRRRRSRQLLAGAGAALVFEKPSARTRARPRRWPWCSLGGHPIYIRNEEIGLGVRESVADVARTLAGYCAVIAARVFDHATLEEMAAAVDVPVVNLLSDRAHPCQAVADLLTLRELLGDLEGRRVVYVGDGNNVAASLAFGAALSGVELTVASPPGYELDELVVERARNLGGVDRPARRPARGGARRRRGVHRRVDVDGPGRGSRGPAGRVRRLHGRRRAHGRSRARGVVPALPARRTAARRLRRR